MPRAPPQPVPSRASGHHVAGSTPGQAVIRSETVQLVPSVGADETVALSCTDEDVWLPGADLLLGAGLRRSGGISWLGFLGARDGKQAPKASQRAGDRQAERSPPADRSSVHLSVPIAVERVGRSATAGGGAPNGTAALP